MEEGFLAAMAQGADTLVGDAGSLVDAGPEYRKHGITSYWSLHTALYAAQGL